MDAQRRFAGKLFHARGLATANVGLVLKMTVKSLNSIKYRWLMCGLHTLQIK